MIFSNSHFYTGRVNSNSLLKITFLLSRDTHSKSFVWGLVQIAVVRLQEKELPSWDPGMGACIGEHCGRGVSPPRWPFDEVWCESIDNEIMKNLVKQRR